MLHVYARAASGGPSMTFNHVPGGTLQRKCACAQSPGKGDSCDCHANRAGLQRRPRGGREEPLTVPPIVGTVVASPGQPLDPATRLFFEARFGHDFGRVRVHDDDGAARAASAVDAEAYTLGPHIVFAAGRYAPGTADGRALIAHELVHTIQQGERVGPLPARVGREGDPGERQAEAVSRQAIGPGLTGAHVPGVGFAHRASAPTSLARKQTEWPAWHQEALADISAIAGKSDGSTADSKWPLMEAWLCTLTPAKAASLHKRFKPSAPGLKAGTDDFAVYVKSKFPANYSRLIRILREIATGKVPEECKPPGGNGDDGDGDGNGDGNGHDPGPTPKGCATGCKALKSMRRSAEGICRLAGEDSDRCKQARRKLQESEQRLKQGGCDCEPKAIPIV